MLKKTIIPMLVLAMAFFCQCEKDELLSPADASLSGFEKEMDGHGNGGGHGGGGGGHGGGGGGIHGGSDYGDLVICLRTPDGIPIYREIYNEEHNTTDYFILPVKVNTFTDELLRTPDNQSYVTFDLNEEGEVIDDDPLYDVKEVEFGRLNVVRAPQRVLDHALTETISTLTQPGVNNIKTDPAGRLVGIVHNEDWVVNYDDDPSNDESDDIFIDSPLSNISLYQELLKNGFQGSLTFLKNYFSEDEVLYLASGALAGGADKTGNIIVDEISYMNQWILNFEEGNIPEAENSPDPLGRRYYDFNHFSYDRKDAYDDKYVRIMNINPDGSWSYDYQSLYKVVEWTNPNKLVRYSDSNSDLTGFSNASDDAVRVIEYLHSSELIVYSPNFK